MKYLDFKKAFNFLPYFTPSQLVGEGWALPTIRKQLLDWEKKNNVIQLKKGLYCFSDSTLPFQREVIANRLVSPSYISLEFALSRYGLIPEFGGAITSITTKKPQHFQTELGAFSYRHVTLSLFDGFIEERLPSGLAYLMAKPEKAVLDFLYYRLSDINPEDSQIFDSSFRFQNLDILDRDLLLRYAKASRVKKLVSVVENLRQFISKEGYRPL